ncbi:hypothetical protein EIP91_003887 [Steccherinum ochraceum]|uniref:Uncharacterized protein n=1 Tax=Steccherinum ochraceum TaxID=92696 RepID=A0A4R0R9R6_9APHY|nr:hypothetical protein EIP91_003887 [Steccherinum ochraceum]
MTPSLTSLSALETSDDGVGFAADECPARIHGCWKRMTGTGNYLPSPLTPPLELRRPFLKQLRANVVIINTRGTSVPKYHVDVVYPDSFLFETSSL